MAVPPRSRTARQKSGRGLKLAAIWLVIGAVAAGFAAAGYVVMTRPADPVARCERGGPVETSTVVLVDTTDPLTAIQQRRVRTTIEAERDRLARGGRLTVVTLGAATPDEPAEIVSACNPGNPGDVNPLFETASKSGKRWTAAFAAPVEAAVGKVGGGASSERSPILATVAGLLTRPDFDARSPHRRLVIVSDMLEHDGSDYSQLHGGDFWEAYRRSPLAARISLDLRGVGLAIDYLARPAFAAVQGERHRRFWRRLFTEAGAVEVSFIGRLPAKGTSVGDSALAASATAPDDADDAPRRTPTPDHHRKPVRRRR